MASANSILDSESGCIAENLPMKVMRVAMENKGSLKQAGALYCGTGDKNTVTIDNETYEIPITIAVEPPSEGVQSGVTYGIKFEVNGSGKDAKIISANLVAMQ